MRTELLTLSLLLCSCDAAEFTRALTGAGWAEARAVAVLPSNDVIFGGIDQSDLSSATDTVAFVGKMSGTGTTRWTQRLATSGSNAVTAIASGAEDTLIVGGWFSRELEGSPSTMSRGAEDGFVARLSAVDGALVKVQSWGGAGADRVRAVAALESGGFLSSGELGPNADLGLGPLNAEPGEELGFVARYGPDDSAQWVSTLTTDASGAISIAALASSPDRFAVAGTFAGRLRVGTFVLEGAGAFVACGLISTGEILWAQQLTSSRGVVANGVALTSGGRVALTVNASGAVTGAGTSESSQNTVVAEYDAAGALRWVRAVNETQTDSWPGVSYLPGGQLVVGVSGAKPRGVQLLRRIGAPEGKRSSFVVALTAEGEPVAWAARGPEGSATLTAMGVNAGRIGLVGVAPGLVLDPAPGAENPDVFVDSFSWSPE